MKCIDAQQTAQVDAFATRRQKIPLRVLMERAGTFIADTLSENAPAGSRFFFFCGNGNNGGDGYAAAVILSSRGYKAYVFDVTERPMTTEAGAYYRNLYREKIGYPLTVVDIPEETLEQYVSLSYAAVEAIYGSGFHGTELPSPALHAVRLLNRVHGPVKAAIDIPVGVNGTTGELLPNAFHADITLSLGFPKRGLYFYPGCTAVGRIMHCDLGIDLPKAASALGIVDRVTDAASVKQWLPARHTDDHKGSTGRAALLVGSETYPGAALLSAESALRMGAGYTVLLAPPAVTAAAVLRQPSLIVSPITGDYRECLAEYRRADAFLVGCGLPASDALRLFLYELLQTPGCPLILDAGAITSLALDREASADALKRAACEVILLPHPKEFSALTGIPVSEVQRNRYQALRYYTETFHTALLLKGYATVVIDKDGRMTVNTTGSDALGKAGSGDVLAGAVVSLAAGGVPLADAAAAAAYLHGAAGDTLEKRFSRYGVVPSDLPCAMAEETAACLADKNV